MDNVISFLIGCAFTLLVVLLTCRDDARPSTPTEPPAEKQDTVFTALADNHLVRTDDAPIAPAVFTQVCWRLQSGEHYTHAAMTGRSKPLSRAEYSRLGGWFVRRGWMVRNPDGTYSPTEDGRRLIHATVTRTRTRTRSGGAG